jgi:predicted PurR-regulated permease PerM
VDDSRAERSEGSVLEPDVDVGARATPVEPGAPMPDLAKTGRAVDQPRTRSVGVTILAVLAVLYTLYFARDFLMPIAIALLLDFFFSPVVRALARLRVRPPYGAGLVIVAGIGLLTLGAYQLSGPIQRWVASAPATVATAQVKLGRVLQPLERVTTTAQQVERATNMGGEASASVVLKGPSLLSRLFGTTQRLVAGMIQVIILLYFLLAAGDLFLQKLVKVLPQVEDKKTAVQIARKTEASISTYLLTAAAVNVGEGVVVTIAMYMLGMPNPLLWGVMVVVLEFIPYIGAAAMVAILTLVALTVYDSVGRALLVPAVFIAINLVQGNLISPLLLGHRLTLNPVAIFVGLGFWFWIWGIPGAFMAVPLLAAFKIFCDHIESLAPVGEFLGQRDEGERRATVRIS